MSKFFKDLGKNISKGTSRATQNILESTGRVEKHEDSEFEMHHRQFKEYDMHLKRLQHAMSTYNTSLQGMSSSLQTVAQELDFFYGETHPSHHAIQQVQEHARTLDGQIKAPLAAQIMERAVNPIEALTKSSPYAETQFSETKSYFVDLNIAKRKLKEKQGKNADGDKIAKAQAKVEKKLGIYNRSRQETLDNMDRIAQLSNVTGPVAAVLKSHLQFLRQASQSAASLESSIEAFEQKASSHQAPPLSSTVHSSAAGADSTSTSGGDSNRRDSMPQATPVPPPPPAAASAASASGKPRALALYDYSPDASADGNQLRLRQGQTVTVLDQDASGWWKGEVDGRVGYFPSNYCQLIH